MENGNNTHNIYQYDNIINGNNTINNRKQLRASK